MTTAPSSDPPAQSASAATAPALMDYVVVGPGASRAPASSASSVEQPASARRRHRPTDTIDTTSTDGTGASGSQPEEHPRTVSSAEDGEGHPGDQQSYQHRIRRAPSGCTDGGVA
ncbi:hypothetical protein L3X38_042052 [Prunus dulcis]|uniref:Uncharacterized protein n=1 Tax=Prunus dulcis TaxID=3755 RepID=A0AAD4YLL5_PRUDU|nr:hypothetical protein L3X38_042052 [Prunus dulcis]